jgi:hypothetical protein
MKGNQVWSINGPGPLQRGDNLKKCKNGVGHLDILFLRTVMPEKFNLTLMVSDIEQRKVN